MHGDVFNEAEEEFREAPVTRPGSPMRWRLEQLLREHRWEDALDQLYCMSEIAPSEKELISRCIGLVEEKLVRRYERILGDRGRAAIRLTPDGHPAWDELDDDALRVGALVNGVATFDDIIEESALGRFAAMRELARLVELGHVIGMQAVTVSTSPLSVELAVEILAPPVLALPRAPRWPLPVATALSALVLAFGVAVASGLVELDPLDPPPPPPAEVSRVVIPQPEPPPPAPVPDPAPAAAPAPVPAAAPAPIEVEIEAPAPPPRGPSLDIAIDNVSIDGPLSTRDLSRAVARLSPRISSCPALPRKPATLRAVIVHDRAGDVTQAAVSGPVPVALRQCVRSALERLHLGAARPGRASFTIELVRGR